MKKVAVIATALLGVFVIGAYFLLSNRPDSHPAVGSDSANEDASAQERQLSDDMSSAVAHAPSAKTEEMGRAVEEAITRIAPERYRHEVIGDKTDFRFFGGEIGYVDVESIVQRRDPYSVIELLRNHHVLTGADESLELQIESTVDTHRGIIADFFQVIGGVPTEARGSVGFDSSGAVYVVTAVLYKSNAADAGAIKILQAEAEAIALEAVRRFSEPRRAPFEERGWPLLMETNPGELRYALAADAGNELRAEWRVGVMTANPRDSLEVLVDGATGDVVGITRTVVPLAAQSQCTELTFRVCDGLLAQPPDSGPMTPRQSCDRTTSNQVVPIFDGNECVADDETLCKRSEYTKPREEAYAARDYVKARGTEYLQGVGGADCRIDILVNTETETEGAAGEYDEEEDVIRISNQPNPETVAHEVFHAVSKGSGDIEHGLVYSMDAIYKEGADSEWNGPDGSLTTDQKIYGADELEVVGNAMYRIYKRMGAQHKKEVFRFALEVDKKRATSLRGFRRALVEVAEDQFSETFQQAVAAVLVEMGINDAPPGTIPESILEFIVAKMTALALKSEGDEATWAGAAAAEAMREIRRRLGLDDDQVLRSRPRRGG